jgi:hypothetical protein
MRRLLASWLLLALAIGCGGGAGEYRSQFHGADLLDDGETGLVSFTYGRYRIVDRELMFGGGRASYVEDTKLLARLDTRTGEVEVILREAWPRGGNGTGNWMIHDSCGRLALVHRERRTSFTEDPIEGFYALIDVDTGDLQVLEPERELAAWGARLEYAPRLLDGRGALLYSACSLLDLDEHRGLFLRRPNGSIEELGIEARYVLHGEGTLYLWFPGDRDRTAYDLATGARRPIPNPAYAERSKALGAPAQRDLQLTNDRIGVELATKQAGAWVRTPVPIDFTQLR